MIRRLSEQVRGRLRTGVALTSVAQCVEELVLNSLDAGATCIAVRVDLLTLTITVLDNGAGISKDQLPKMGERYCTSKCHTEEDFENLKYFGYRGEALASLCCASSIVEIVTRPANSVTTYCKYFLKGKPQAVTVPNIPRPGTGTTITARDLFYNLPVRKKSVQVGLELEKIRFRVAGLALMWPLVSFSLRDDVTGNVILQTHKCSSTLSTFSSLFGGARAKHLREVVAESNTLKVSGYVSRENYSRKDLQFVFVNRRLVLKSKVHQLLNTVLSKSVLVRKRGYAGDSNGYQEWISAVSTSPTKIFERNAVFVINIECPLSSYDILFDPSKTLIEFHNWPLVTQLIEAVLVKFMKEENLFLPSNDRQCVKEAGSSAPAAAGEERPASPDIVHDSDDPFDGADEGFDAEFHNNLQRKQYSQGISTRSSLNTVSSRTVRRPAKPKERNLNENSMSSPKKSRVEDKTEIPGPCNSSRQLVCNNLVSSYMAESLGNRSSDKSIASANGNKKDRTVILKAMPAIYSQDKVFDGENVLDMEEDCREITLSGADENSQNEHVDQRSSDTCQNYFSQEKAAKKPCSTPLIRKICLPSSFAHLSSLGRLRSCLSGRTTPSPASAAPYSNPSNVTGASALAGVHKVRHHEKKASTCRGARATQCESPIEHDTEISESAKKRQEERKTVESLKYCSRWQNADKINEVFHEKPLLPRKVKEKQTLSHTCHKDMSGGLLPASLNERVVNVLNQYEQHSNVLNQYKQHGNVLNKYEQHGNGRNQYERHGNVLNPYEQHKEITLPSSMKRPGLFRSKSAVDSDSHCNCEIVSSKLGRNSVLSAVSKKQSWKDTDNQNRNSEKCSAQGKTKITDISLVPVCKSCCQNSSSHIGPNSSGGPLLKTSYIDDNSHTKQSPLRRAVSHPNFSSSRIKRPCSSYSHKHDKDFSQFRLDGHPLAKQGLQGIQNQESTESWNVYPSLDCPSASGGKRAAAQHQPVTNLGLQQIGKRSHTYISSEIRKCVQDQHEDSLMCNRNKVRKFSYTGQFENNSAFGQLLNSDYQVRGMEGRATDSDYHVRGMEDRVTDSDYQFSGMEGRATESDYQVSLMEGRATESDYQVSRMNCSRVTGSHHAHAGSGACTKDGASKATHFQSGSKIDCTASQQNSSLSQAAKLSKLMRGQRPLCICEGTDCGLAVSAGQNIKRLHSNFRTEHGTSTSSQYGINVNTETEVLSGSDVRRTKLQRFQSQLQQGQRRPELKALQLLSLANSTEMAALTPLNDSGTDHESEEASVPPFRLFETPPVSRVQCSGCPSEKKQRRKELLQMIGIDPQENSSEKCLSEEVPALGLFKYSSSLFSNRPAWSLERDKICPADSSIKELDSSSGSSRPPSFRMPYNYRLHNDVQGLSQTIVGSFQVHPADSKKCYFSGLQKPTFVGAPVYINRNNDKALFTRKQNSQSFNTTTQGFVPGLTEEGTLSFDFSEVEAQNLPLSDVELLQAESPSSVGSAGFSPALVDPLLTNHTPSPTSLTKQAHFVKQISTYAGHQSDCLTERKFTATEKETENLGSDLRMFYPETGSSSSSGALDSSASVSFVLETQDLNIVENMSAATCTENGKNIDKLASQYNETSNNILHSSGMADQFRHSLTSEYFLVNKTLVVDDETNTDIDATINNTGMLGKDWFSVSADHQDFTPSPVDVVKADTDSSTLKDSSEIPCGQRNEFIRNNSQTSFKSLVNRTLTCQLSFERGNCSVLSLERGEESSQASAREANKKECHGDEAASSACERRCNISKFLAQGSEERNKSGKVQFSAGRLADDSAVQINNILSAERFWDATDQLQTTNISPTIKIQGLNFSSENCALILQDARESLRNVSSVVEKNVKNNTESNDDFSCSVTDSTLVAMATMSEYPAVVSPQDRWPAAGSQVGNQVSVHCLSPDIQVLDSISTSSLTDNALATLTLPSSQSQDIVNAAGNCHTIVVTQDLREKQSCAKSPVKSFCDSVKHCSSKIFLSGEDMPSTVHAQNESEKSVSNSEGVLSKKRIFTQNVYNKDFVLSEDDAIMSGSCQLDHTGRWTDSAEEKLLETFTSFPSKEGAALLIQEADSSTTVDRKGEEYCSGWIPVTDPVTGRTVYMNSLSGHTMTQEQWKNMPQEMKNPREKTVCKLPDIQCQWNEELSPLSRYTLKTVLEEHSADKETEEQIKWRDGKINNESDRTIMHDILATWENPVFKRPDMILQTTSRSEADRYVWQFFEPTTFTKQMLAGGKVIGQLDNKFIACLICDSAVGSTSMNDSDDGLLVLFDQHAAHERVRLEQLTADVYEESSGHDGRRGCSIRRTNVQPPRKALLSDEDVRIMVSFRDEFDRIGVEFTVDKHHRDRVLVHTIPACIAQREANDSKRGKDPLSYEYLETMLREHTDLLRRTAGAKQQLPQQVHRLLATHACKGAVKFGDKLSAATCRELVSSLASCSLPFQCAHGRPSIAPLISLRQLKLAATEKRSPPKLWKLHPSFHQK